MPAAKPTSPTAPVVRYHVSTANLARSNVRSFLKGLLGLTICVVGLSQFLPAEQLIFNGAWDDKIHLKPEPELLKAVIEKHRPEVGPYVEFYRHVHQNPEISSKEAKTAELVASHLGKLGYKVSSGIGGHGVVGVMKNGPGKVVLMRAELDALPILEQTNVSYRSEHRMIDRYGNERPVMHACGHDMNMAALLMASSLLKNAFHWWKGTLLVVFQPDEEETGGAQAMVDDGLYDIVPVPDLMLGQHVVADSKAGTIAIRSGPVLVAADSLQVRVFGGPCGGSNPQRCVDPIPLSMQIVLGLQDAITQELGQHEDATVACWGFHAGEPGNDYVAYADILLDIKTVKPNIRLRVLDIVKQRFLDECRSAGAPHDPEFNHTVRAPLTTNSDSIAGPLAEVFAGFFGQSFVDMPFTSACEDFPILGAAHNIPYAYWNFGGTHPDAEEPVPSNHSPLFAPEVNLTLRTGSDAMALAALTFLA
ncbi:Putative protein of unknown function [Podospora comata]|uniref:Peptidase M20 dimerisation domain-containing protein n=1 Tax=Podospora comata TaxID=48703 RepID=A0ABY6SDC9_PODCO|nr:Putative protein of unknown function [Podospora comata]